MPKAIVLIDYGFEDVELGAAYSTLPRAGVTVETAGLETGTVKGLGGSKVQADTTLWDLKPEKYDAIVIPGGEAPATLSSQPKALRITETIHSKGGVVIALSQGTLIAAESGVLNGKKATCYPGFEAHLVESGAEHVPKGVVRDERVITTRGPAFALEALTEAVRMIAGEHLEASVSRQLLLK